MIEWGMGVLGDWLSRDMKLEKEELGKCGLVSSDLQGEYVGEPIGVESIYIG
jgi:hypothetical protein